MTASRGLRLRRLLRLAALGALGPLAAGCVSFRYSWVNQNEPIEQSRIDELRHDLAAGAVGLQACLDRLGAPVLVWEAPPGIAIAYGWRDSGSWNIHVGYTWEFIFRAHFDYTSATADLEGVVLWFDGDLRLTEVRRGRLSDLVQKRQPPGESPKGTVSPERPGRRPPPTARDGAP